MSSVIKKHSKKVAGCLCCFRDRTISDDASSITPNNVGDTTEYTSLLDPLTKKRFPSILTRWKRSKRAAFVPANPFTVATDGVSDSTDSVGDITDSEPDHDWLPALPANIPARGAENHRHSPSLLGSWPDSLKQWLAYDRFSPDDPVETLSITRSSSWETADRDISELFSGNPPAGTPAARDNSPATRSLRRVPGVSNIRERASAPLHVSSQQLDINVSTNQPSSGELTGQPPTRRATSAARLQGQELRVPPLLLSTPSTQSQPQRQQRPSRLPVDWADTSEMGTDSPGSLQRLREQLNVPPQQVSLLADHPASPESNDTARLENIYGQPPSDTRNANERFFRLDSAQQPPSRRTTLPTESARRALARSRVRHIHGPPSAWFSGSPRRLRMPAQVYQTSFGTGPGGRLPTPDPFNPPSRASYMYGPPPVWLSASPRRVRMPTQGYQDSIGTGPDGGRTPTPDPFYSPRAELARRASHPIVNQSIHEERQLRSPRPQNALQNLQLRALLQMEGDAWRVED